MVKVVRNALRRAQHDLICAHPDLAGKAAIADEITDASKREQAFRTWLWERSQKSRVFGCASYPRLMRRVNPWATL
jgi:2-oxo-4-hydroxy-4-carboxy--5-ureidoimidazoline (OHCU) decarboxylase